MNAQQSPSSSPNAPMHESYMKVVQQLHKCYIGCEKLFTVNTPKEAGMSLSYLHLKRLQACSDICEATARYLLKDGIMAEELCEIAGQICEQCADSCDQVENGAMQAAAEVCRETGRICLDESYRIKRAA